VSGPLVLSLALYSPDPTVFLWSKSLILFSDTLKRTRFITRELECQSQGTGAMNGPVVLSLALYSPDPTVFLWSKTVILLSDTLKRTRFITRERQCQSQGTGAMNGPVVLSLALYSPDPTVFLWSKTVILLSDTLKRTRLITREHQCQSQGTRYRERTAGSFTRAFFSRSHSFPTVRNSS
jgi:hypothetical protein